MKKLNAIFLTFVLLISGCSSPQEDVASDISGNFQSQTESKATLEDDKYLGANNGKLPFPIKI